MEAPKIKVGILTKAKIDIELSGHKGLHPEEEISGAVELQPTPEGKILCRGKEYDEVVFTPVSSEDTFVVKDVVIGVNFHWEREEDQRFAGSVRIIPNDGKLLLINEIDVEMYLKSVISSEMSSNASLELLKAHAVISRGWLYAQIDKNRAYGRDKTPFAPSALKMPEYDKIKQIVKWYDRDDHTLFDVCADDHCQRYQGLIRQTNPNAVKAVEETSFEVLTYEGKICDTRFSKCCGGVMEVFESCWDYVNHPYLVPRADSTTPEVYPILEDEAVAEDWINSKPDAFCNCTDKEILSQVLNDYDQETTEFYRWTKRYGREELSELVKRRSDIDFGQITAIKPLERGSSGRITRLLIEGTKETVIVGKELEIRKWLSESHLYSSAFTVETITPAGAALPSEYILHGAGWGHGVGLCQIGAAVMGAKGYGYREILDHYFPGSRMVKYFDLE